MRKNLLEKLKGKGKVSFKTINIIAACVAVIVLGIVFLSFSHQDDKNIASVFDIQIPGNYVQPLTLTVSNHIFSVQPVQAKSVEAIQTAENAVKYIEVYENTDVELIRYAYKLKESIILKRPGHPDKFVYQINIAEFDFEKDSAGNLLFYPKGRKGNQLYKIFTIPAPFLIDADGKKSPTQDVKMSLENNILTLIPNQEWLNSHEYPIILDPTIEINILNIHSHPQQGDNWEVEFTTQGQADLYIIPDDQATIDDDEFVALYCGERKMNPQILADDVIYYPNWECLPRQSGAEAGDGIGRVIHYTKKAGNHTLRFEFGDKIVFAYNTTPNFSGDYKWAWGENIGWNNFEPTNGGVEVADDGLTGYVWAENIGWIKLDYDGTPGAVNTSATNWGVTNDGGNLDGYAWGENIGWVNFNPSNSQVIIDGNGDFSGYAWAENVGWIKFDHSQTSYTPQTTWSPVSSPTVTTQSASSVNTTTATAYGNITATGGADVTTRGFKYGLTEADTWSTSETGTYSTGSYNLGLTSLTKGTTYYLRSYATNSEGTSYGAYIPFVTGVEAHPVIFKNDEIFKKNVIFK